MQSSTAPFVKAGYTATQFTYEWAGVVMNGLLNIWAGAVMQILAITNKKVLRTNPPTILPTDW